MSFLARVGLLSDGQIALRQSFELYLLTPPQMVGWVVRRTGLGYFRATIELLRVSVGSTMQEKRTTFRMQRVFRKIGDPRSLVNAAPEKLPYRNKREIEEMFQRLGIGLDECNSSAKPCVSNHLGTEINTITLVSAFP